MKPWFERDPERALAEREFWTSRGFSESRDGDALVFSGTVELKLKKAAGEAYETHRFDLTITYLTGFPYLAPEVDFVAPAIRRHRHQSAYGKPCLFPPEAWHPDQKPSEFLSALRSWLQAYVVGEFPRELAIYELPEYLEASGLTVLGTPGMNASARGHNSGSLRITELVGLNLAVVTHLQGAEVGAELLAGLRMRRAIKQQERVGGWYRLRAEPRPPRTISELSDVLSASDHIGVVPPPRERPQLTALLFEDGILHQERWLFLDIGTEAPKTPRRSGRKFQPHARAPRKVLGAEFYPVSRQELFRRLEGVRDPDLLAEREVTVFGLGAIGSHATLALTREGVGEFTLCDYDTLKPGNVVRHALDLSDVGQFKAVAMKAAVQRINPFAETSIQMTRLRDPTAMEELMSTAHLVVSAIGDNTTEEQLNEVAVRSPSTPAVLYARTLHAGDAVRIFLCRPGGACFHCLMLHREDGHPSWVTVPPSELAPVRDEGCAAPSQVGAGLTSQLAGVLVAQIAVEALTTPSGGEANHWLWLLRDIPGIQAQRVPKVGVLQADWFDPHPECSVCQRG